MTITEPRTLQPGDVLSSSWGYDQTNVSFYKVLRLTKTGIWLSLVGKRSVNDGGGGGPSNLVVAEPDRLLGEPFWRKAHSWSDGCGVAISSYEWASVDRDEAPRHETAYGWGH